MTTVCFGLLIMWCQPATGLALDAASFCRTARPIYWSAADTRMTKEAIDEHNRVGKKLCGWGVSR